MYGEPYLPYIPGSGGGNAGPNVGGCGGGSTNITVKYTFKLEGTLSANGLSGVNATPSAISGAGGGSGGSISVSAGELLLMPGAVVSANGGDGGFPFS